MREEVRSDDWPSSQLNHNWALGLLQELILLIKCVIERENEKCILNKSSGLRRVNNKNIFFKKVKQTLFMAEKLEWWWCVYGGFLFSSYPPWACSSPYLPNIREIYCGHNFSLSHFSLTFLWMTPGRTHPSSSINGKLQMEWLTDTIKTIMGW